jgi:glutamate-1-semialdehyde 2,1-aminomutase
MRELAAVGGIHPHEAELARLMCERFGLDRVRFTNSGTEANLFAITAARMLTGREHVLVFEGGYHGGVLYFAHGVAPWNAPYPFVLAPYNDLDGAISLVTDELAAVLVEPMLGSGGCIPAEPDFLRGLFAAARDAGALCIADEVMTSRHGRSGLAALLGAEPDLRTFGKYIGGGFSFGAFGGRAEVMDQFDSSRPGAIPHAGTFNNNVATMTAGCVVLRELFPPEVAEAHTARGERFRAEVAKVVARYPLGVGVTGYGSMLAFHASDSALQELLFLGLYRRGIYTAPRGMVNLSLPLTDDHLASALSALDATLAEIAA